MIYLENTRNGQHIMYRLVGFKKVVVKDLIDRNEST